jgi:CheY-like chemotaxis protein
MSTNVLVVDDNDDNLVIIRHILLGRGFTVRTARSGAEALDALASERPDVILLDVMMPEMDGMEVLDRIKASPGSATIPVILVTARAQDEDVLAGYRSGADYYITKPFTSRQLIYALGLVLGIEQPA